MEGQSPPVVQRLETGIAGFDRVLGGGLPKGRSVLINGESGTGKSVLLNEFIYHGVTRFNQPGVIIACEEPPEAIRLNVGGFGWDYAALESGGTEQLALLDLAPFHGELESVEAEEQCSLIPLVDTIIRTVERLKAERVAIDGMASLFDRFASQRAVRHAFLLLSQRLGDRGVTTLFSCSKVDGSSAISKYGLEEFIADGVVELSKVPGERRTVRQLVVHKLRGLDYLSGRVEFEISKNGLEVFPLIPLLERVAGVHLDTRKAFGIPPFDAMLRGGLPEGHVALISGNTGAGKSTFGLHFVQAGLQAGEASVYVSIEEAGAQLQVAAGSFGWDFSAAERQGRLLFIDVPFADIRSDQVLYQIVNGVNRIGAKRLVVDSISALLSIGMNARQHRLFMEQLVSFCKSQGITVVLLYAVGGAFGVPEAPVAITAARFSSVVDAIILSRSMERHYHLERMLSIVKMRGSGFDSRQFHYEITEHGIEIGSPWAD
ncbi:ATPase domain-containing protein [Thiohalomonas denitrificans]|uniref:non-specific serine/threonine protein kinase n=1 Tax=Thiohalomonas denitrificans TaxID=415747 RepID=A0A1G5Q980_9GAMM|nr:ATPase domain-containing protein [Thiohalomonas denitrificans]SCZ58403.1 circadian clock protein KaiC [Thiohalomonas denitrificans]